METDTKDYAAEWQETISKPCYGGHKVDGKIPFLQDVQFDGRTCDCGRLRYAVEGCGCGGSVKELHGYPNQQ